MSILVQISDLIAKHDVQDVRFTKCPGCSICDEIKRLRTVLEPEKKTKKKTPKKKKEGVYKSYNITKKQIEKLTSELMTKKEIADSLKVPYYIVDKRIRKWFPDYEKMKKDALQAKLDSFQEFTLTYKVYTEMKAARIEKQYIAKHFNLSVNTLTYWEDKWEQGLEREKGPKNKEVKKINSLIKEKKQLEARLQNKETSIQRYKKRIAEIERNTKKTERRSVI